jgi:hypothetical protein
MPDHDLKKCPFCVGTGVRPASEIAQFESLLKRDRLRQLAFIGRILQLEEGTAATGNLRKELLNEYLDAGMPEADAERFVQKDIGDAMALAPH